MLKFIHFFSPTVVKNCSIPNIFAISFSYSSQAIKEFWAWYIYITKNVKNNRNIKCSHFFWSSYFSLYGEEWKTVIASNSAHMACAGMGTGFLQRGASNGSLLVHGQGCTLAAGTSAQEPEIFGNLYHGLRGRFARMWKELSGDTHKRLILMYFRKLILSECFLSFERQGFLVLAPRRRAPLSQIMPKP